MAYDFSKDVRTELASIAIGTRGDYLKVAKIVNTGNNSEAVDIRRFYTHSETGEVCPDKKGIRINSEMLYEVLLAATKGLEENEVMDLIDELQARVDSDSEDTDSEDTEE